MSVPFVTFSDGHKLPLIGLGTWQSKSEDVKNSVRAALDGGYRHIDTAWIYGNESDIGEVLQEYFKDGKLKRDDLYITTKLWITYFEPDRVEKCLDESLSKLGVNYVDLYLIHFPCGIKDNGKGGMMKKNDDGSIPVVSTKLEETWKAMEKLKDNGKTRSIGVSNFNTEQVERICKIAKHKPVTNQVECNAYFNRSKFQEAMKKNGLVLTSYASLGSPGRFGVSDSDPVLLEDPVAKELAGKYKKTVGQILLRYLMQRNILVIPKSVKPDRVRENFNVLDFKLSDEDMERMNGIDKNCRLFRMNDGKDHPEYPFNENF